MQINCSTFAQMCLMGITYDNSRYANPTGRNIGNLYKYDSMAEFNYRYTKDEFAHIEGADFGKMYANKMAKYAFDRGLLYHAKPDYSNIEVGDLLFNTAKFKLGNDRNFFWNIGHVSFVNEVLMNEDGSKTIIVMEKINLYIENNKQFFQCDPGISLSELSNMVSPGCKYPVLAALEDNMLKELSEKVYTSHTIEFVDYTHPDGRRTYVRSLCFLLQRAVSLLYPDNTLFIDYALPNGMYGELRNREADGT